MAATICRYGHRVRLAADDGRRGVVGEATFWDSTLVFVYWDSFTGPNGKTTSEIPMQMRNITFERRDELVRLDG